MAAIVHARGLSAVQPGAPYDEEALRAAGIELILPVGTGAKIGVGDDADPIQPDQEQFLAALVGISAGAVENVRYAADVRRLNLNLDRKLQELRTLLELVRGFTAVVEPEEVVRLLALTLAGQFTLSRYAVAAWKEGHAPIARAKGARVATFEPLRGLAAAMPVSELESDELREELAAQKIVALVPLRTGEETIGVLLLGARPGGAAYSVDELEYTRGLADQAAVALENAWHFRETVEKKKLEKELELAADIQRRLLPAVLPAIAGYDAAANTRPARHVGGDYYDVLPRADGRVVYCVADVSGKGIAASLLMSNFQASLRALLSSGIPLAEVVTRMNNLMHASTAANKFVTAIFMDVDPASGHARGGQCRPQRRGDPTRRRHRRAAQGGRTGGRAHGGPARTPRPNGNSRPATWSRSTATASPRPMIPEENEYSIERLIDFLREQGTARPRTWSRDVCERGRVRGYGAAVRRHHHDGGAAHVEPGNVWSAAAAAAAFVMFCAACGIQKR